MQVFQRTIAKEITFSGIGLHTGKKVNVKLLPAPPDTGIVFVRTDISSLPSIKVSPKYLSKLYYATNLSNGEISVQTVEHLMAALSAFGIDNLFVYLDSEELPILDGSSAPYIYLFEDSGVKEQKKKRKYLKLTTEISIEHDNKRIKAEPFEELIIDNTISFDHTYKKIRYQRLVYSHNLENFKEISKARTFCFYHEVEALRAAGLARGGSLENAIVIDKYDILNESGLRMENEFVAHKTLDLVGDLYILGYPLLAKVTAYRTGHALNAALVKTIYQEKAYEVVELEIKSQKITTSLLGNEEAYSTN
ncbi:UDP-3-O-(3-hydroxymyristoyl) N-acetylglucosamine deacetylase [Desulfurobacterium thermolithotrophum DSM 11699]|uniref:UDP-3-O-acyl-N-acetylglucosamine deacetylase n=1 Tax=Desulfurobacterium thermolithotrophum (strain DSM 11699 / BSA) TaxID=868864 RepID=F0S427_DESTD|nr:UDP-3-O-acyl-N-acetylglucosamine deacetylase [Desulfurobacterium thermolithotrophum]ADY73599.1 UDP-3-O-(3-hydroxymyristoyl) N-acetylglucosamine deacetylase [Desulfurobacterium thermolithotrophum DSM 11699]